MRSSRLHFEFGRKKPVGRAVPSLRRTPTASSKGSAAGDASIVQRAQHSLRVAAEAAVAPQDVIQRIRYGRARERGSLGDKVAETLPSGTVRDHRVEGLASRRLGQAPAASDRPRAGRSVRDLPPAAAGPEGHLPGGEVTAFRWIGDNRGACSPRTPSPARSPTQSSRRPRPTPSRAQSVWPPSTATTVSIRSFQAALAAVPNGDRF